MSTHREPVIRRSFNQAADSYNHAADWQQRAGKWILDTFTAQQHPPTPIVLDLGAGTGFLSRAISSDHPNTHCIAIDLADHMLQHLDPTTITRIGGSATQIPLTSESIDCCVSNMMLQWCHPKLPKVLSEIARVLKPGGSVILTTLAEGALMSLQQAWAAVDPYSHINAFPTPSSLTHASQSAGLAIQLLNSTEIECRYESVLHLMRHLKKTGASQLTNRHRPKLLGRAQRAALMNAFSGTTTYNILRFIGQKPGRE